MLQSAHSTDTHQPKRQAAPVATGYEKNGLGNGQPAHQWWPGDWGPAENEDEMRTPTAVQPISERFPALEEQEVVLTCSAPGAGRVHVAGTFNGWSPNDNPLVQLENVEWCAQLMLKSGRYEYRFVVDGCWIDDPQAAQSAVNPYGGINSVIEVGLDDRSDLL